MQKYSNMVIPFAAISTVTATSKEKAYAADIGWWEKAKQNGDVKNGPFANSGIAEDKDFMDNLQEAMKLWSEMGAVFGNIVDWLSDFGNNITEASLKLLSWIYEAVTSVVLKTPTFLFANEWFKDNMLNFSLLSVSLFTLLTLFNGVKKIVGHKKALDTKTIIQRYSLAVLGIGFAPIILENGLKCLNKISEIIISIGHTSIEPALNYAKTASYSLIDTLALIGFDILLIATLIPVFLQNGRRWFDLLALSSLTPFVLSAAVFDTGLIMQWMHAIKKIAAVQLMYAFNIAMIGIFIFASKEAVSGWALITKILIVVGGLNRMANPPAFLKRHMDNSNKDVIDMFKTLTSAFSWQTLGIPSKTGKKLTGKIKKKLKGRR
ncbi:hypothetical protein P8825_14755 [Shouchella clausii]|uniref:hypothetical protein n=1 Tax=Shouchella clausii TaxID=79880 RepID=UPI002DBB0DD6|nr:hypothetical protein [Shouchella clausii]MEB5480823.1 hypothetical protein [Shouchella clausii]